jgi:hypothetical protein
MERRLRGHLMIICNDSCRKTFNHLFWQVDIPESVGHWYNSADLSVPTSPPPIQPQQGELMGDTKPGVCNLQECDEAGKLRDFRKVVAMMKVCGLRTPISRLFTEEVT